MTTITVIPENPRTTCAPYRAISGDIQAVGPTVGQAIDELRLAQGDVTNTTLVIIQPMTPDELFTESQRDRLSDLMGKWRMARDTGSLLSQSEQMALDALVKAEVRAAGERAARLLRSLAS